MDLLDCLRKNIDTEKALIEAYEKKIEKSPEGRLNCKRIHGKLQYFCVKDDGTRQRIQSDDKKLIIELRTKGFFERAIRILNHNLKLEKRLLSGFRTFTFSAAEILLPHAYSEKHLQEWLNTHYSVNTSYPEHKIYQTSFGLMVRSKSEVLIAELLHAFNIPFHYDEEITLRDSAGNIHIFSVDFIIMTPAGDKIYWEHMGRFDKEEYRIKNFTKIKVFYDNEIILSDNFIITMESKKKPLSALAVDRIIKEQIMPFF